MHCSDLGCELPCTAPFTGQLTPGLQLLHDLQVLDLSHNALSGPLPVAWGNPGSFPSVVQFDISHNQFTGNMPDSWSIGPAFVNIITLDVRTLMKVAEKTFHHLDRPLGSSVPLPMHVWCMQISNNRLSGPFPALYAVTNDSFLTLLEMDFSNNQMTGPVCAQAMHPAASLLVPAAFYLTVNAF